jgi:hypothetical protein
MTEDPRYGTIPRQLMRENRLFDMAEGSGGRPTGTNGQAAGHTLVAGRLAALTALLALADLLFWRQPIGVSLAVFAAALFTAACHDVRPLRRLAGPGGLLLIGVLPVVEHLQALSLAFLVAATASAVVWARLPGATAADLAGAALVLLRRLPFAGLAAAVGGVRSLRVARSTEDAGPSPLRRFLRAWAFPLGGTLVFASLLMDANPLIARLFEIRLDAGDLPGRALFWTGIGLILWPVLDPVPHRGPIRLPDAGPLLPGFGINAASTLRALLMFNLLIGLQTVLDLSIFAGGAALPEGMSYASYAHRGAYPLLATALLAGAFAVAARPYLGEHHLIRPLMLLWLVQNVALTLSALLRLDLYVGVYGLTYLRAHAAVWMALVAAGLALTAWQVVRGQTTGWLMRRCAGLGAATLYLCAFVNFAALIAAHNLTLARTDVGYLCTLGPTAAHAFAETPAPEGLRPYLLSPDCIGSGGQIEGWRDWGFRKARVAPYLPAIGQTETPR